MEDNVTRNADTREDDFDSAEAEAMEAQLGDDKMNKSDFYEEITRSDSADLEPGSEKAADSDAGASRMSDRPHDSDGLGDDESAKAAF